MKQLNQETTVVPLEGVLHRSSTSSALTHSNRGMQDSSNDQGRELVLESSWVRFCEK